MSSNGKKVGVVLRVIPRGRGHWYGFISHDGDDDIYFDSRGNRRRSRPKRDDRIVCLQEGQGRRARWPQWRPAT